MLIGQSLSKCISGSPHTNGGHLLDCEYYECYPAYFKCPNYYCVPWWRVCNKIWDCPGGADEKGCSDRKSCPGQYRCHESSICVNIESICDRYKIPNCPYLDDEMYCLYPACPSDCTCVLFTITCHENNGTRFPLNPSGGKSYLVALISNRKGNSFMDFLKQFKNAAIFSLRNNGIIKICVGNKHHQRNVTFLDVSKNLIKKPGSNCFENMNMNFLLFLNISQNKISEIDSFVFKQLQSLLNLDLSYNQIQVLRAYSFYGLVELKELNLIGNTLVKISLKSRYGSDITVVKTTSNKLCCLRSGNCTSEQTSSVNLCIWRLLNTKITSSMLVISLVGFCLGISVIVLNILNPWELGGHNYRASVIDITLGDLVCCIGLIILASADLYYNIFYFEYEYLWRQSIICFFCMTLFISHAIMSCLSINFLAYSRFQITKYPLDSKFIDHNDSKFVDRSLLGITTMSISLAVIITLLHWFLEGQMSTGLCMIYGSDKESIMLMIITCCILFLNIFSMVSMPLIYYSIYITMKESGSGVLGEHNVKESGTLKQFILCFFNHICWLPSTVMLLISISISDYPRSLIMWFVALILPFHSIINPIALTYSNLISKLVKYFQEKQSHQ